MKNNVNEQMRILLDGIEDVINEEELRKKIEKSIVNQNPLIVKLGLDPTAPDIHLGHSVVLRKMRQFQEFGHKVIIIIGDFTARIGDPTGKSKTRKPLTREEVLINAETYKKQLGKILDPELTEVRFNSEWLEKMNFSEIIELMGKQTVSRVLERDDFKNRFSQNRAIGMHELMYPLIQGMDSVVIKADVEIGGTEQTFNILMGRTLQKEYNQEKQAAIFVPLLEGTDGIEKMSKSLGNYIGIDEGANEMFGKVMSIPDELIVRYFRLVTDVHPDDVDKIEEDMKSGELSPRDAKLILGETIVDLYHPIGSGKEAKEEFINVFSKKNIPENIEEVQCPNCESIIENIITIIMDKDFAKTKREARRFISQGAVKINGCKFTGEEIILESGDVIQVGKRRFVKIR